MGFCVVLVCFAEAGEGAGEGDGGCGGVAEVCFWLVGWLVVLEGLRDGDGGWKV